MKILGMGLPELFIVVFVLAILAVPIVILVVVLTRQNSKKSPPNYTAQPGQYPPPPTGVVDRTSTNYAPPQGTPVQPPQNPSSDNKEDN